MKFKRNITVILLGMFIIPLFTSGQPIDAGKLKLIRLKQYPVKGLIWKGESAANSNWNKITETPDGKIWFSGGDHWGTDGITGPWPKSDVYERPWGLGNTVICYYDPKQDKSFEAIELDRASSIYSNAETPGHGKIHGNITSDSKGNIYFAGYMGLSFYEVVGTYYPKTYPGAALCKYDPLTKNVTYLGIPVPYDASTGIYYDEKRNSLCGITPNKGRFWRVKISTMELNEYGSIARMSRLEDRVREFIMDREGYCYFANDIGGLTKYDPDNETFTDLDVKLPGLLMDFRASVVSSDNVFYCITTEGFVWSYDPKTNKLDNYGHVLGMPEQGCYTPNISLDEEWGRLYFIANNHGGKVYEPALVTLTILDLKTRKYHYVGKVDGVEGCFGAKCAKDHVVYFSSFGQYFTGKGNEVEKDSKGKVVTRPYLIRYNPPQDIESLQ
jgi:streptogramin lyase